MSEREPPPPYQELPEEAYSGVRGQSTSNAVENWPSNIGPPSGPPPSHVPLLSPPISGASATTAPPSNNLPSYPTQSSTLYSEAPVDECDLALDYCRAYPIHEPQDIYDVEVLDKRDFHLVPAPSWGVNRRYSHAKRFSGDLQTKKGLSIIRSYSGTKDCCFISQLPLYTPRQDIHDGKLYFECEIDKLRDPEKSVLAIGYSCLPYPPFRLPGWNRASVGVHSDDGSLFFSNDEDGQPCVRPFHKHEVIGIGLDLHNRSLIVTRNGKLEVQLSIANYDQLIADGRKSIYACIGVFGKVEISVNFGHSREFLFKEFVR